MENPGYNKTVDTIVFTACTLDKSQDYDSLGPMYHL